MKKSDEGVTDRKFFKKKISFRKKEVVEGADLYGKGHRARKGRKAAKGRATTAKQKPLITVPKAIKRRIKIDDAIALSDLAKRMGIKASEMIKKLMDLGVMATVNQVIDFDTAVLVAAEFDLVLCRNLVFTYFDEPLQCQSLARILCMLRKGGVLVLGIHEKLPENVVGINVRSERLRIFGKT